MRESAGRGKGDKGSATVWTVTVMALLWFVAVVVVQVGVARVARHQAQSAADLSALAGAARARSAPEAACRRAADTARANHARLLHCALSGPVTEVMVAVPFTLPVLGEQTAQARARAGPAAVPDAAPP